MPRRRQCPIWGGYVYVQLVSYLELLRLQGHGVVGPLLSRRDVANLLYSIARSFNICEDNCKIEVRALLSSFWVDFFH